MTRPPTWSDLLERTREQWGSEAVDRALRNTAASVAIWDFSQEQLDLLEQHGYFPQAAPRGVSGPPFAFYSHGAQKGGYFLRNHICKLDGVNIDRHETSDLDNELRCIHCNYMGRDEWGWN